MNSKEHEFNARKNQKAGLYTLLICGVLLTMLLLISWNLPFNPPTPVEEGLEVNLGNSDQGLGSNQPFLPNDPSKQDQEKYTPPKTVSPTKEALKDVETDDKDPDPAPAVKQPPVTKPEAKKIPDKDLTVKTPRKTVQLAVNPTPAPPKPKAVFHGVKGDGPGGNDADHFKQEVGSQGIAGGKGDQGNPGGDPNSTNYKGGGHGNGIAIVGLQGRKMKSSPSFTDEFNEHEKVAVDITVDASGTVTSAEYRQKGSTTTDSRYKAIAIRRAQQIKFSSGSGDSKGTLIFDFQVKN